MAPLSSRTSRSRTRPQSSPSVRGRSLTKKVKSSPSPPIKKANTTPTKSKSQTPKPKLTSKTETNQASEALDPNTMTKLQLRSYLAKMGCQDLPKPSIKKDVLIDLFISLQKENQKQAQAPIPKPSNKRIISCPSTPPSQKETIRVRVGDITLLKDIRPQYLDSPRSATSKLSKRIEMHSEVKDVNNGKKEKQKERKEKIAKSFYFYSEVLAFLLALSSILLYLRWKFISPLPYCQSMGNSPFCLPIPLHATLKNGKLLCMEGYQLKRNLFSLGHSCIPDRRKLALMDQIISTIKKELSILAGKQICREEVTEMIPFSVLKEHIIRKYPDSPFIRSLAEGLSFEDLFIPSIEDCCRNAEKLKLQCTSSSIRSVNPFLPLGCRLTLGLKRFYRRFVIHIWSSLLAIIIIALLINRRIEKLKRDRIVSDLVRKVLHILAEQDLLNRKDPTIPSSISVPQIRDALFMKSALSSRDALWPLVCRVIDRHSAVRESAMNMKGEQHRVWEWIGSDVLSPLLQG